MTSIPDGIKPSAIQTVCLRSISVEALESGRGAVLSNSYVDPVVHAVIPFAGNNGARFHSSSSLATLFFAPSLKSQPQVSFVDHAELLSRWSYRRFRPTSRSSESQARPMTDRGSLRALVRKSWNPAGWYTVLSTVLHSVVMRQ